MSVQQAFFIQFIKYLFIQSSAFIGFYLGAMILPRYDEIIYPFAPNISLLFNFYKTLLPLGFFSMSMALLACWVYKKRKFYAVPASIVVGILDYKFRWITNLSDHYFHFSFVLVYSFGIYCSYWLTNKLIKDDKNLKFY